MPKNVRIELFLAVGAQGVRKLHQRIFADILFNLFPLILVAYFFAAGADGQEPLQDFDPLDQLFEKIHLQADDRDEDQQLDADFPVALTPRGRSIPQQKMGQIQEFVGKGQGQEDEQNHCLADENRSDLSVSHGLGLIRISERGGSRPPH
jgi:hypothetical protein